MLKKLVLCVSILVCVVGLYKTTSCSSGESHHDSASECNAAPSEALREVIYGRGCCSYHGGQCDCSGGRVVCCDGSLSPSCRC